MTPELKPCPWCGRADQLELYRPMQVAASNYMVVRCNRCGISGPRGAADAWNHRGDLAWSHEKPTRPGWYWYAARPGVLERLIHVRHSDRLGRLVVDGSDGLPEGGLWYGPLEPPKKGEGT